jgi:restriction system protein
MGRRRESFLETLFVLPWWVGLGFGILGFIGIAYLMPAYLSHSSPLFAKAGIGLRPVAWAFLGICWFGGAFSFVRAKVTSSKFDRQRGIESIRSLSWRQFESIVGEALRRRGYSIFENAVDGPDGGVDLVLRKNGGKYFVQCKQWKTKTIGVKPVRELYGVMSAAGATGGFFVTSGTYTADAAEFGKKSGIEMIDGDALARMIVGAQEPEPYMDPTMPKRTTTQFSSLPVDSPSCPKCGSEMVAREAKRGAHAGAMFWGCSTYPRCKGTRAL